MTETIAELLQEFPIVLPMRVAWGEMDAYGHVNNTVFFRYFEASRIEYVTRIGLNAEREERGIGPILHSTSARFRRPLQFPDTAWTGARVVRIEDDRFEMAHRVVSEKQNAIAAEGTGIVVAYNYIQGQKTNLPSDVCEAIARLEGSDVRNIP